MKPFNGYTPQRMKTKEQLPVGAYISVIRDVKVQEYGPGSALILLVDIAEGDQKDFFARDYRAQEGDEKKWRGTLRLSIPTDDGSDRDAMTKRIFNDAIMCIEESNPNYHWDWNEASLKGKRIGHLSRESQWSFNGKAGFRTELCYIKSVEDIHAGRFQMPASKLLKAGGVSDATAYGSFGDPFPQGDEDLPF